ncbi:hypothetical protein EJ05DRAFT_510924 [Pseudovirgaria hyperparasitica]|uniref:TLC domain-containing protein n=1 Tax=Pseudovirgaria hyperparasitica TaxID=470096 RepID=A0A6A6W7U3_9PEZI|nr:uncharacterized protein EJ05DRAFT_510924 [Pseudovirgaria hyperparasitica]KAF2758094.1 hypothetical protein EJ05DRAFT_510924 [Pseudovirgaria hyperparasitica]
MGVIHDPPDHKHNNSHILSANLALHSSISPLIPYSGLILTVALVIIFIFRYIFELFLLTRIYGKTYLSLNEVNRRGFINHHIAGIAKITMLVTGAYPLFLVFFEGATLHHKFGHSNTVTLGDIFIVLNHLFCAMYIFELFFRAKLSPVAIMHHIGAIVIAQSAIAVTVATEHAQDGVLDFLLCIIWGIFDVIAEFWPHVAIILYRCHPTKHEFLAKVFASACITTFAGTVIETVVVMWLFGSLWYRWTLVFKIVTPILHCVFSAAQLWGAWNFRSMWLRQRRFIEEERVKESGMDLREEGRMVAENTRSGV